MKPKPASEPVEHSAAVLEGPIKSDRVDATTTIWRDGQVIREDLHGRAHLRPSIQPIFETNLQLSAP